MLFSTQTIFAYRVFPTIGYNDEMYDKINYPYIAANADGFNLQHKNFGPFSKAQVQQVLDQFTNKKVVLHNTYQGQVLANDANVKKLPSIDMLQCFMLYREAPAMTTAQWTEAMDQNVNFPLITHCRKFFNDASDTELKKQINMSAGVMFEFKVDEAEKHDDAVELIKYCVDNNKQVIMLTTFQQTRQYYLSAYKVFFYYLKENLDASYLDSDNVIFITNTYHDEEVLPDTAGAGGTFGVARWLIEQKTAGNYQQAKISFTEPEGFSYFENESNITAGITVEHSLSITKAELYLDDKLVGTDLTAPYSWSGGILDKLSTGSYDLRAVVTDSDDKVSDRIIRINVLKKSPTVPGFFYADNLSTFKLRNKPLADGSIRHVYSDEWIKYKLNVSKAGNYDIKVNIKIQRSKQFGGTLILKDGTTELRRLTTVLNDPSKPPLTNFTETPEVIFKNVPLKAGLQTLTLDFDRPGVGPARPMFYLFDFNFRLRGAPGVNILEPMLKTHSDPATIKVESEVIPATDNTIDKVELYVNDSLVSSLTEAPYTWNALGQEAKLTNLPKGNYELKVVATDNLGNIGYYISPFNVVYRVPFNTNLSIPGKIIATHFDIGGEGAAYHDFNEGADRGLTGTANPRYAKAGNEDVEIDKVGAQYAVSGIRNGEWLSYTLKNAKKGVYKATFVAAANTNKTADAIFELNGKEVGSVVISETGSNFNTYKNFSKSPIAIREDLVNANLQVNFSNPDISTWLFFFKEINFVEIAPNQTITFPNMGEKNMGDADFDPGAYSDASLPITYTSSDESVATIVDGKIHLVAEGTTVITAKQAGDDLFNAATDKTQTLKVNKESTAIKVNKYKGFVAYPNPATSEFMLEFDNTEHKRVFIYNPGNKLVYATETVENKLHIDLDNKFNTGMYVIKVVGNQGVFTNKLLVK